MAEVLSQSQIDALLNSMQGGGAPPVEEKPEKKYPKYDFTSPRKFTKDRLKMLSGIFDNYSRIINTRINGLLRATCEVELASVEEQRYYEFSNALTEGTVLAVSHLNMQGVRDESPVLFYITTPVMLSMIDRLLGGTGDVEPDLPDDYIYTDLEIRLYENLMKELVSVMGNSWENYITIHFSYIRTEVNPTLVQLIGYDETVVIVGLNIKFPNCTGRMSLCLPGEMLTNIFSEISKSTSRRTTGEDKSEEIFDSLRESELEIVAELARTRILLSDLYHLNVGDVVDIKRPKDSPVFLNIGGRRWFDGKMGTSNKQVAVKIGETYIKM